MTRYSRSKASNAGKELSDPKSPAAIKSKSGKILNRYKQQKQK